MKFLLPCLDLSACVKKHLLSLYHIWTTWRTQHFYNSAPHIFLRPTGSLSYPCQHKGPYIFVSSSLSFSPMPINPIPTVKSSVMSKSLAPPLQPSRSTLLHLQTVTRVWSKYRHHHSCSEEHCCASLLSFPRPLDCAELFGYQRRRIAKLVTVAHKPFEFQIGNVPRFRLLD